MAHPQTSSATPRRWGQSLVEFALVAPLLVILVVGVIELGIIFSVYIGLTNSAREGARAAAVYLYPAGAPTNAQAVAAVPVIDTARELYMEGVISETLSPIISFDELTIDSDYIPPRTADADKIDNPLRAGDTVSVTAQITRTVLWGLLGQRELLLRASAANRIEPGGDQ